MARPGCTYNETVYFTQGTAESIVKRYAGGDDSYSLEIRYDGDQTIEVIKSGYGSVVARATYGATNAQVPYIAFGTRKSGILPGLFSASFGEGLIAQHAWQFVAGKFNSAANKLVTLGNGSSDGARSNALTVDWDGTIEIPDSAACNKTARMLGLAKTAGDTITLTGLRATGYVTNTRKNFSFTIHTPFRFYGVTGCTISGSYTIRQNNGYHFGSTASTPYTFTGHYNVDSINGDLGIINVTISTGYEQTSAVNNNPASILLDSCVITLT